MFVGSLGKGAFMPADVAVRVRQPFMLPYSGVDMVRAINASSVARTLRKETHSHDGKVVLVATVPNAGDYCAALPSATVVYYCVDDFTQWPGVNKEVVSRMERRLVARADILIAASPALRDRLAGCGRPVHLLTHGVDVDLFTRIVSEEHESLGAIPRPRAGFFGLIDARTDQELLAEVARRMPDMSFVLSGPVEAPVGQLACCSNVHFTGPVPYTQLPSLISGLDVLLLPYRLDALGNSLSPLKLKEYLVTGRPIVSTPIAEARMWKPHVATAGSAEEWVYELRLALSADQDARRRNIVPSMNDESWRRKAQIFVNLCLPQSTQHSLAPELTRT
jgi:glycosyltransferase involved in cell wall biosynthesis